MGTPDTSTADIRLRSRPWGTEITLDITGLPARDANQLWTFDRTGAWINAATWAPTPAGVVRLTGASSSPTNDVERILVNSNERDDVLADAVPYHE